MTGTRAWAALRARRPLLLLALLGLLGVGVPAAVASGSAAPVPFSDAAGIHVVSTKQLDSRQYEVRVLSAALARPVDLRVLLPTGYAPAAAQRYPVLYLFHGTSGRASDWVTMGGAVATTAPLPLITVMPDAGFNGDGGGWFTNWVDTHTTEGPSQWETFHVSQVIPWVDANLRTVASRSGRAIAGLSQGGFGATTYAARHPDTFLTAASFSGAPEIDRDPDVTAGATAVIESTAYGLDHVQPEAMFGSRATNEVNWQGHDPSTLMTNLRGMNLLLWTATGAPGPYDSGPNPAGSAIEALTHLSTQHFHDRLVAAGIPSTYHDYTFGTHTWPYWARDLRELVGPMMQDFAHPTAPARISYTSVDARWAQWGWSVSLARTAPQELSALTGADSRGFTLAGSGTGTVTTPAVYAPGSRATVVVDGPAGLVRSHPTVGRDGRLTVSVPLGQGVGAGIARVSVAAPRRP